VFHPIVVYHATVERIESEAASAIPKRCGSSSSHRVHVEPATQRHHRELRGMDRLGARPL